MWMVSLLRPKYLFLKQSEELIFILKVELGEDAIEKVVLLLDELPEHFQRDEVIAFAFGRGSVADYDALN